MDKKEINSPRLTANFLFGFVALVGCRWFCWGTTSGKYFEIYEV